MKITRERTRPQHTWERHGVVGTGSGAGTRWRHKKRIKGPIEVSWWRRGDRGTKVYQMVVCDRRTGANSGSSRSSGGSSSGSHSLAVAYRLHACAEGGRTRSNARHANPARASSLIVFSLIAYRESQAAGTPSSTAAVRVRSTQHTSRRRSPSRCRSASRRPYKYRAAEPKTCIWAEAAKERIFH